MNWIKKYKFGMIVALVTIILIISISYTSKGRDTVTFVEGFISRSMAPIQRTLYRGTQHVKNFFGGIMEIGSLKERNQHLEEEIKKLKEQQVELEILRNENERLSKLLNFQKNNRQFDTIIADIVSIDPEAWFNVFVINKGSKDGIEKDMPVAVSEGLVGKIIEVASNTSKVLAISDTSSMVNGLCTRTGDYMRVQGTVSNSLDGFVNPDASLIPGDLVVTSGLGGIYPQNIIIGEVERVEKKEGMLEKRVIIQPAVDFQQLNEVLVLKKK